MKSTVKNEDSKMMSFGKTYDYVEVDQKKQK